MKGSSVPKVFCNIYGIEERVEELKAAEPVELAFDYKMQVNRQFIKEVTRSILSTIKHCSWEEVSQDDINKIVDENGTVRISYLPVGKDTLATYELTLKKIMGALSRTAAAKVNIEELIYDDSGAMLLRQL